MKEIIFKILIGILVFIFAFPLLLKALSYVFMGAVYLFNQYLDYLNLFFAESTSLLLAAGILGFSFLILFSVFMTWIMDKCRD